MKKVLSLIISAAMVISCFAVCSSAFADELPALISGASTTLTIPKNTEEEIKLAVFKPEKTGYYEF